MHQKSFSSDKILLKMTNLRATSPQHVRTLQMIVLITCAASIAFCIGWTLGVSETHQYVDIVIVNNGISMDTLRVRERYLDEIENVTILYNITNSSQRPFENTEVKCGAGLNMDNLTDPLIYLITPTYPRSTMMADMTRLSQTLMHIKQFAVWIVVEDAPQLSNQLSSLLQYSGICHVHLLAAPNNVSYEETRLLLSTFDAGRGSFNRNRALAWLRANATRPGVLYFADDDNAYDIRIFHQIRYTALWSIFPVGGFSLTGISTPVVKDGRIIDFYDPMLERTFPLDMAGFAINVDLVKKFPKAAMVNRAGYQETTFLESILDINFSNAELLADNCTQVLVWHVKTERVPTVNSNHLHENLDRHFNDTNLRFLMPFPKRTPYLEQRTYFSFFLGLWS